MYTDFMMFFTYNKEVQTNIYNGQFAITRLGIWAPCWVFSKALPHIERSGTLQL